MDRISELLDNVGWRKKEDLDEWQSDVFRWMTEATNRIQELQYEISKLKGFTAGDLESKLIQKGVL